MSSLALPDPVELLLTGLDAVARLDQLVAVGMAAADIADQIAWGKASPVRSMRCTAAGQRVVRPDKSKMARAPGLPKGNPGALR